MSEGLAFPHLKVVCDEHRWKTEGKRARVFLDCEEPGCQAVKAQRREEVRAAGAPTEEEKARWRAQLIGRAEAKHPTPAPKEKG